MKRVLFVLILLASSCSTKGRQSTKKWWNSSEIVLQQKTRTAQFANLVGGGAIEFSWSDEKGKHREQGDLDFWKQGDAISLRISKLGELIVWFGGRGKDIWFFDATGDETTLTIGGDEGMFKDVDVALILLGLKDIPVGEMHVDKFDVTLVDAQNRVWNSTLDPSTGRPTEIELIDGNRIAKSLHRTPIRVEIQNVHSLHWPETGGLIDLTDNQGNAEIKIAFSYISTVVEDEPMDRVMDLEYLTSALTPAIVSENK